MSYLLDLEKTGITRNNSRRNPNLVRLPIWDKWRCFRTSSPEMQIQVNRSISVSMLCRLKTADFLRPSPYTQFLPTCLYHHPHSMNPSNPQGSSVYITVHSRPPSAVSSTLSPRPSRVSTSIEASSMPRYLLVSDNPDCAPSTHQPLMLRDTGMDFRFRASSFVTNHYFHFFYFISPDQYAPKYTQKSRRRRPYLVYPKHRFLCRI